MRVTKKFIKSLGYYTIGNFNVLNKDVGACDETFSNDKYPFNHFPVHRKGTKFFIVTNKTKYDCSDVHGFLATVYFCGIFDGEKKKITQIKAALEISENIGK